MSGSEESVSPSFWGDRDDAEAVERFETLVNAVEDGIYQLDAEGRFVGVNDKIVETTGYGREELLGAHASLVLADDDIERINRDIRERVTTGNGFDDIPSHEITIETADGEVCFGDLQLSPLVSDGEFRGSIGIVRDVSEQLRREHHLESELEEIFGRISDAFYAVDNDWRITHVNERMEELVGTPEEELMGENVWDLFPEAVDTKICEMDHRAMETGEPLSYEAYYEPLDLWFEAHVYPSDTGMSVYFQDISDRKEREQELERYETIVETIWDGVTVLDADEQFVLVNDAYCEMTGYDREELIGEHATYVHDDAVHEQAQSLHEEVMAGDRDVATMEYELRRADGETIPVEARFGPYETEDGQAGGVGVIRDVTERKEREQRLEETVERLEASNERLEQFAHAASHDLQEPLRMVSSYLQLLEQRYEDELDVAAEEYLEFAVDGADRMRRMVDGLLEYSRVETQGDPLEPVDLDDVLADVREDLQIKLAESNAELTAEALPEVRGDSNQLRQVFQNLLDNAIEYSGDDPPRIHVGAERDGAEWMVTVQDQGIGIDPAYADNIFEVFERLHTNEDHAGTGIGLALVERIVERHGGEIWLDSELNEGATFSFTLPAVNDRET